MNRKALDYLPDWHRNVEPNITEDIVNKRTTAINKIIKKKEITFWLDIINISLDLQLGNVANRDELVNLFKAEDTLFRLSNNQELIKNLAQITLCVKLEGAPSNTCTIISMAIKSYNNFSNDVSSQNVPILQYSTMYLENVAKVNRSKPFDGQEGKVLAINNELKKLTPETPESDSSQTPLSLTKMIVELLKESSIENKILAEEVNILWWIIGGFSEGLGREYDKMDTYTQAISSAYDLADLTKFYLPVPSSQPLLAKVLKEGGHIAKATEIIQESEKDIRVLVSRNFKDEVSNFTPFQLAIRKSISESADVKWLEGLSKKYQVDLTLGHFAYILYNEVLLHKLAQELV